VSCATLETVGPYRLERLLGTGGMAEVFQAYDERLHRRVAVKHVRPETAYQLGYRTRFRNESSAVARLNHPSIVQVFDVLEGEEGDWIVMEFVDGPTLKDLVSDGPLPIDEALAYGRQVLAGLAEAHGKGILHRDLKPENVMIAPSGHVKILDFGLAKRLFKGKEEITISIPGKIMGTSRSMSPEQAQGLEVDARSDLFSFGVLLYEMVTGDSPFRDETLVRTLKRVCLVRQKPARAVDPRVPAELSDLIDRLLEKEPEGRPGSARQVADELAAIATRLEAAGGVGLAADGIPRRPGGGAPADDSQAPTVVEPIRPLRDSSTTVVRSSAPPRRSSAGEASPPARRWWLSTLAVAVLLLAVIANGIVVAGVYRPPGEGGEAGRATAPAATPRDTHDLYRRGMAELARFDLPGNVDRAIESFRAALSLDADSASAHAGLARGFWFHYYSGDKDLEWLERGLPVAERAVEIDSYLASARVSRGLILASLGRAEEAAEELERALQLDPTRARARVGLGLVHESRGRLEAAAEAYRRAIELAPDDRWPQDLLGALHYREGRYDEAADAFRRSIELAPDGVFGYRNLAAVHYLKGRHAEAAAVIQKALEIQPSASLYSNLGTLLYAQGLYPESAAAYERALELPGGEADHVIWANLGDARGAAGEEEAARRAYRRAIERIGEEIELRPEEPALRSRRALYRARWGGAGEALSEVASIRMAAGRDGVELGTDVLYRLAVTSELAGDRELALELLEEALEGDYPVNRVASDGDLRALREDPRYRRLAERVG